MRELVDEVIDDRFGHRLPVGFNVLSEDDLNLWSHESKDPLRRFNFARMVIAELGVTDDPAELSMSPHYSKRMREMRLALYRRKHRPRRERSTKLTYAQCEEIKQLLASGATRKSLAARFGVSTTYIGNLANGEKRMNWGPPAADAVDPHVGTSND